MAFFGLIGNDRDMAKTTYRGEESASGKAARQRRAAHWKNVPAAARKGQKWEDEQRARQDRGRR